MAEVTRRVDVVPDELLEVLDFWEGRVRGGKVMAWGEVEGKGRNGAEGFERLVVNEPRAR